MEISKKSHPYHKFFETTKVHVNDSWRWLCLSCTWLRRLLRACALGRSLGGRDANGSASALAIGQRPAGVVVNTEKGLCAFVLLVSACCHQHAGERKVTQSCVSPGKPEQPPGVCQQNWQPHTFSVMGAWAQACTPTSPELHPGHPGRSWKAGKTC